ncbi:tetratricopeptide repeat protein [Sphingomonas sp. HDW15A]|uniref:tetratricopeptide repeat protein n=1 Tax=Sphingomonas sp. HDW15A TaxID=2714942 RepID=UPI001407A1CF|nr:tetratricopeptide repeat protein [Sphingomonas sp. HDW15A]QIK96617.1 tetratricopeptide repeat protein [Sphingomonas sp. HDW15A]
MALPPSDTNEAFLREVDENLRRDQAEQLLKKNAPLIVGGVLLLLALVAGYLYWHNRQQEAAARDSETLVAAMEEIGAGRTGVDKKLDPLLESSSEGIAAQAKLTKAAVLLSKGDKTGAIALYRGLAADSGIAQSTRDLATIRMTALEFDTLEPAAVIARLEPLAKPESAWFGSAGEMTAMALLKQNKTAEAGRLFAALAGNKTVPMTIRSRAVQIAGTLGVDASAAIDDLSKGPQSR